MASISKDVRIVLVGKTGSGKSASGNKILGRDAFKKDCSPNAVTTHCEKKETTMENRQISLIDTPGLFHKSITNEELKSEIQTCIELSLPGPHVFLLVIKVGRFTEEEQKTVKWIQENFGEDAAQYTIILFTHIDMLDGKSLHKYIQESPDIEALIERCGGRYHAFNNRDQNDQTQVKVLLQKIDKMVYINGRKYYTNEIYEQAQRRISKRKDESQKSLTFVGGVLAVGLAGLAGAAGAALAGAAGAATAAGAAVAVVGVVAASAFDETAAPAEPTEIVRPLKTQEERDRQEQKKEINHKEERIKEIGQKELLHGDANIRAIAVMVTAAAIFYMLYK